MKKRISLLLVLFMVLSIFSTSVLAVEYTLDGKQVELNTIMLEDRTLIKADDLSKIGLESEIKGDIIILKNKDLVIEFKVDKNKVKVNKSEFILDCTPENKESEIYLPLRLIFETMNYKVSWDKVKGTSLTKQSEPKYPVVFENNGVTYTIKSEPKTVVSMAPDVTETFFAIGAGDKVKGRTKYCKYPEEVKNITDIGTMKDPSIEKIVDINPDLVLAATHFKPEVLEKINEAKINTFAKDTPKTLEELNENVLVLGNIANKNYEARAMVSAIKSKVQSAKMLTDDAKKPSVYYVVGTGEHGEYTAGSNTFIDEIIVASGAVNAAADAEGWAYTLEKLIDKNPEFIFGPQWALDKMKENDNYKALTALSNGKFIVIDDSVFSLPSQRIIDDGLKLLVQKFHPEVASKLKF